VSSLASRESVVVISVVKPSHTFADYKSKAKKSATLPGFSGVTPADSNRRPADYERPISTYAYRSHLSIEFPSFSEHDLLFLSQQAAFPNPTGCGFYARRV
jgi:hypothetical protein